MKFYFIFFFFSTSSFALKEFYSDYCTMAPDGKWGECCYMHDLYYWSGGPKSFRKKIDSQLRRCIKKKSSTLIANLFYLGVRIGHLSPVKHKTHWGWAWNNSKWSEFSKSDIFEVSSQLKTQGFSSQEIEVILTVLPKRL